jgi:uncharacterized protein YegP (UPF0339 family)
MAKNYIGTVYQGANEDWYWRLNAANGNIVANGGEGYKNRNVAVKMMENVTSAFPERLELVLEPTPAELAKVAAREAKVAMKEKVKADKAAMRAAKK